MPSLTLTVTQAEANRIAAAATALGFPDAKSMIIAQVKGAVASFEQGAFVATYVPVPLSPT